MTPRLAGIAQRHREAFARLQRAILEDYSYRDLHHVDWRKRFRAFAPRVGLVRTPRQFAVAAAKLLSVGRDIHLWLRVEGEAVPSYRRRVQRNIVLAALPQLVPGWRRRNAVVSSGTFPDGVRYLCLRAWPAGAASQLEPAYRVLRQAAASGQPLILDVRANGGGAEPAAARFAGCFIRRPVCYAKHLSRRAGRFRGPVERWLKPNPARPPYTGRVAVLIGPGTVSSCESFALMMRQVRGCRLIGQRTAGASGNPKPLDLGNGVVVLVPSWKDLTLDGTCLEGRGVAPDIEVRAKPGAFEHGDPVLAAALRFVWAAE